MIFYPRDEVIVVNNYYGDYPVIINEAIKDELGWYWVSYGALLGKAHESWLYIYVPYGFGDGV